MGEEDRELAERNSQGHREPGGSADSEPKTAQGNALPPAGPHARPDLTDEEKTPGTGILPEPGDSNPSPTG